MDFFQRTEHESDGDTNYRWHTWNGLQELAKKAGGFGNQRKNKDHTNDSIVELGQSTEQSPGDPRKLAVTQTSVKDY